MPNFSFMLLLLNSDNSSSFSRDTVKTFLESFLQHITNHYEKHRDSVTSTVFIYLSISDFSFIVILRLLDLVPVANSVPEVRSCASIQNAFLLPTSAPSPPRNYSQEMKESTIVFTHTTFIISKRREL
jgi:hypothetical protein